MYFMKKIMVLFFSLFIIFCLLACQHTAEKEAFYSFTDDLGRRVNIHSTERVAALLGSFADMWILSGGEICATADDAWEDFGLPLKASAVNLGSAHRPSREELIASAPDFVLASSKLTRHLELMETLESMDVPVAYFDVACFDDYARVMDILTDITGKKENYNTHVTKQKNTIEGIVDEHKADESQTVLVMRASASSIRTKKSSDTMLGGMLLDFGCINIADKEGLSSDNLSVESISRANPEKIFFIETGDNVESIRTAVEEMFSQNPLWYKLDAVKNGKVYYMDKKLYNLKPNARFAEAYEKLEKILYEE